MGVKERREREKLETRDLILEAARELFANEGYEGVSMRKLAEKIEYSPTAIYVHFADKEELFRAGEDYVCAADGRAMEAEIRNLLRDDLARQQFASNGLETIQRRHTCAHRAVELLDICEELER